MKDKLIWAKDGQDWPNRALSHFVTRNGLTLHVQSGGEGPVALLLHGTGASTHSWRALIPLMQPHFRIIAPDLPGHGFSDTPPLSQLSLPCMAGAMTGLVETLDEKPALIIGHSAGAAIALRMALDGRVAPKAIISINGALKPFGGAAAQIFPSLAKMLVLNPFVPRFFAWKAGDAEAVLRLITGTGSRLDAEGLAFYQRLFTSRAHVEATLAMMAHWDLSPLQRDLPKLKANLTLIVGEKDRAVAPEEARMTRETVPGARVVLMPQCGHLSHEEKPVETLAQILAAARREGVIPHLPA